MFDTGTSLEAKHKEAPPLLHFLLTYLSYNPYMCLTLLLLLSADIQRRRLALPADDVEFVLVAAELHL